MMMAGWKVGPALAAGCPVVLKPSELTPLTALRLAELAADIFPPGVFNVITGDGEHCGAALVAHPKVAIVSITGEVTTGQAVMRAAADTLKRVHLELGGKAPVVVFDDADLDAAIAGVRAFGYYNAGQDCTAATRVLAGPRVHDDFVAGLAERRPVARGGRPGRRRHRARAGGVVGPSSDRVAGFVERAVAAGADGGDRRPGRRPARLLLRADGDRRRGPGQRDRPARGVRSGRDRAAVHRRGRGGGVGQRRRLRPGRVGVDDRRGPGHARGRTRCGSAPCG